MRVIEQTQATTLGLTDEFLIDGSIGTRAINFENLLKAIDQKIGAAHIYGDNIPYQVRKTIWGGRNFGSTVTQAQWNAIKNGTFENLFVGDYWRINDKNWRIMDFNYWLNTGDSGHNCTTPHLVIVPDSSLYTQKMNSTNTTEGGYIGSAMRKTGLNDAKTTIRSIFGSDHILSYRNNLTNAVSEAGNVSGTMWVDADIELLSEPMLYGANFYTTIEYNNNNSSPDKSTIDKIQLFGFSTGTSFVNIRESYWLRDSIGTAAFTSVSSYGTVSHAGASVSLGVRPVFGLIAT